MQKPLRVPSFFMNPVVSYLTSGVATHTLGSWGLDDASAVSQGASNENQ